jgi:two-component system chemotaxis response regulator CheY
MPEMNGLELIRTVRKDPDKKSLPIVVLTTEGSDEDIRKGMLAGATEYLVKPFQPQKLHSIIDRLED